MTNQSRSRAEFAALRELVGLSRSALADRLGVNIRTVMGWESNRAYPSAEAWKYIEGLVVQLNAFVALVKSADPRRPITFKLIHVRQPNIDADIVNARIRAALQAVIADGRDYDVTYAEGLPDPAESGASMHEYYILGNLK